MHDFLHVERVAAVVPRQRQLLLLPDSGLQHWVSHPQHPDILGCQHQNLQVSQIYFFFLFNLILNRYQKQLSELLE